MEHSTSSKVVSECELVDDIWTVCCICSTLYWYLSLKPVIAVIPCVAGVVMFTALFWVFADYIGNTPARIIVKIIILGVFIMIELCVWINATLPWLESKEANKPRIRVEK